MFKMIRNKVVIPFFLDYILYYRFQRILLDDLRYVDCYARFEIWVGDLLNISIKRAWVTSVLNIMSPRMSLSSRNNIQKYILFNSALLIRYMKLRI